jgi:DNA-binding transcriptional LysR family regulator
MDLRQLAYLVAVAEEASFTRAAERVHISQSGVSAQVRQLERELGAPLIDRSGRRATVTAAGAAALGPARAALAAAEAVRRAVDDVAALVRGHLVVGMVTGCTVVPLFDALAALRRAHPGVDVALVEDTSDRLVAAVRSGASDVALVGVAGDVPDGLEARVLVREPVVGAVAPDHPLAARAEATLAEVAAHPLLALPEGTGIRTAFDRACAARGVTATVALEASAPDAVAGLAARGLGVAVLSASMVEGTGLHPVALADAEVPALLALVWRPGPSPAARAFVESWPSP